MFGDHKHSYPNEKVDYMSAPPPPYHAGATGGAMAHAPPMDNRPAGVWKLCDTDDSAHDVSPFNMLNRICWGRQRNVVEMEFDFHGKARGFLGHTRQVNVFRGSEKSGGSPTWTYAKFDTSIKRADAKKQDISVSMDVSGSHAQRFSFQPPGQDKLVWTTNEKMGTGNGQLLDTCKYELRHKKSNQLVATFAYLQPNGMLDCCLQILPQASQFVAEDVIALTLGLFINLQWEEMVVNLESMKCPQRIASLERLRHEPLPGRSLLYGCHSPADVDAMIERTKQMYAKRSGGSNAGVNGVIAGNNAVIAANVVV